MSELKKRNNIYTLKPLQGFQGTRLRYRDTP